jgi:hypothetical protein
MKKEDNKNDYINYLNWCKVWNKKPYEYKILNEYMFETKQYNQPYDYAKNGKEK